MDKNLRSPHPDDSLTVATLLDMVLGENATDRSTKALIYAIGDLVRMFPKLRQLAKEIPENLGNEPGYRRINPNEPLTEGDEQFCVFEPHWLPIQTDQTTYKAKDLGNWRIWRRKTP